MEHIVGIGECRISNCPSDTLKAFALASCIAVTAYDPVNIAAGMVHIALPYPLNKKNGKEYPFRYATTAIPLLLDTMSSMFKCSYTKFELKLYGGANSIHDSDIFNIGRRNIEAVMRTLECLNLKYKYADIGGEISRTIELQVGTGSVNVLTQPINI